jgi:hypothetical protein
MTFGYRGRSRPLAIVAFTVAASIAGGADAKDLHAFRSTLAVRWGRGAGSEAFRADLTRSIADALATRCFSDVEITDGDPASPGPELVFVVVLSDEIDETRFEDPIASVLQPDEPSKEMRRVARFSVRVDATLSARSTGTLVHRAHFFANVSRRPLGGGEDPQAVARLEAIDRIVVDLVRSFRCGSAKLDRKIRDAVRDDGASTSGPR